MKNHHILALFTASVATHSQQLALIANDKTLTYQALQQEMFGYISYLQQQGVKAGDRVGILLPRDSRLIVALLSVLACGASYVPLDSRQPKQRHQMVLGDSECQFVITTSDEKYEGVQTLLPSNGARSTLSPIHEKLTSQDLAYIIYTSGSTGKPKGVMIHHANACSMIDWALSIYTQSELAYTLAATSICFDLSIYEIFVPLASGGCVVLVDHALSLLDQNMTHPISLINTVPSAMEALLIAKAIPQTVQTINLAGEALQQAIVNEIYATTNVQKVYNLYGPSETTTYSAYYLAEKNNERVMVPIGKAIKGTQIYLLDQHQQPVPKLVRGEIYIAGEGVSQGYCNRPQETEERFIERVIHGRKVKLYRTGDLARLNHAQELEYLGRIDQQIKIRGFRIEPDEIAHVIKQHEKIKQAYLMTHPEVDAGLQLIAYIVTSENHFQIDTLRNWLTQQLPDYMVPHYFIILDALPTNSNGKIDRSLLPLPHKNEVVKDEYQNDIEIELSKIWKTLLTKTDFQRNDNFFYVGGHSLLAAKLQAKIQEIFHVSFSLEEIFEYPSLAEQAKMIHQRQEKKQSTTPFEILARPKEIPLSFSQQRLWYLQYAEEATPISNIPITVKIKGPLDLPALRNSFCRIIERHEILRTTYQSIHYHIVQIIHDQFDFDIKIVKCDANELAEQLSIEANKKFDLSQDLMIRVTLFQSTDGQNILMVTQHHIASDAWSLNILMQELSAYYHAYHQSKALPALPVPTQYADYSCWQRYYLNAKVMQADLDYWKNKLENAPDTIRLPYDRPRSEIQTYRGEFYQWELSAELVSELKQLANRNESTLFMVLLTAFNLLLYRYTQQKDFCVGILSANRPFSQLEHTLGFFVNTLVTRHQMDSTISIRQLLKQVKRNVLECLAHQQVPFDKVVESLRPNRQTSRHPFFQVLFSLQNALESDLELDDLTVEACEYDRKISKFDLTLSLVEKGDRLSAIFEFNSDLFYRETIERMTAHYIQILSSLSKNIDVALNEMNLVTPAERQSCLIDLNAVNTPYPSQASLADLFHESVNRFPQQTAIVVDAKHYSYAEVDILSNQLANLLKEYAVGSGSNVGLLLPRGLETIISMLAVMKSGACYVPMDPNWPTERLDYIVQDCKISLVLSLTGYTHNLPSTGNCYTLLLDEAEAKILQQSTKVSPITTQSDDPCYIMYTSGSTGKPKGVIATHQGVTRLVKQTNYVQLDEHQTLLQVSQLVFDGATFDIWGSLLNGATLVLMPNGLPELNKLAELINQHTVTTLFVTTQLFNTLVDYKLSSLAPLKQLFFGGDVASTYHVEQFKKQYPDCALSNIYGPTECTTFALSYLIPNDFDKTKSLPLGRPISNTNVVILSEDLQMVPIGVPGEICLGGPGLARGYHNMPELTLEKFIANPIADLKTSRLYRTGDIGYYRADGQIAFLGRADDQVKLRGYRIELPEIEQALRELNEVIDALVIVQKPEDLLVAYVIANPEYAASPQAIRHKLTERLPHYMQPDAVVMLNEYPLMSNGKIDKSQLPRHHFSRRGAASGAVDQGIAGVIHQIWVDILNDDEVTDEDNFFEIGGNSLKIVHVLDRLQSHFAGNQSILAKLDITTLFQYPTIISLTNYLKMDESAQLEEDTPARSRLTMRDKRKEASQ